MAWRANARQALLIVIRGREVDVFRYIKILGAIV
jgi:hypothetical protein